MRKVREVLRLRYERGCSQRQIQASTGLSKGSVSDYLKRAEQAGLSWETMLKKRDGLIPPKFVPRRNSTKESLRRIRQMPPRRNGPS